MTFTIHITIIFNTNTLNYISFTKSLNLYKIRITFVTLLQRNKLLCNKTSSILKYFIKEKKKCEIKTFRQKNRNFSPFCLLDSPPRFKDIATTGSGGHFAWHSQVYIPRRSTYVTSTSVLSEADQPTIREYEIRRLVPWRYSTAHDFYSAQSLRTRDKVFKYFLFPNTVSSH